MVNGTYLIQTLTSQVQAEWRAQVWGEPGSGARRLHPYYPFYCASPEEGRWTQNNIQQTVNNTRTHSQIITDDLSLSGLCFCLLRPLAHGQRRSSPVKRRGLWTRSALFVNRHFGSKDQALEKLRPLNLGDKTSNWQRVSNRMFAPTPTMTPKWLLFLQRVEIVPNGLPTCFVLKCHLANFFLFWASLNVFLLLDSTMYLYVCTTFFFYTTSCEHWCLLFSFCFICLPHCTACFREEP